jgi:hypothetical protein
MWSRIRNWHRNLSWNAGYRHGKKGVLGVDPWWVDTEIYYFGYGRGMSSDLAPLAEVQSVEIETAAEQDEQHDPEITAPKCLARQG